MSDTKEQILRVAEELFASQGYAGTSMRAVIREAGVNLAAVNYHFGSKEELFVAVVGRVARPIVERQAQQLNALNTSDRSPTISEVLEAVIAPCLAVIREQTEVGLTHAHFIARCRIEPLPVQALAEPEFASSQRLALEILQKVLPDQSAEELKWKFDLVIAAIVRVLAQIEQMEPEEVDQTIQRLVKFTTYGFSA